jgi:hypothetical protein
VQREKRIADKVSLSALIGESVLLARVLLLEQQQWLLALQWCPQVREFDQRVVEHWLI